MANIADLFGRLLLDDSGFEASVLKSAEKAGDKAGQTLGQSLSRSLKAGGLAALSTVFASAALTATELDTAVKQYAADVGASAEESDKAKTAANDLFKVNRTGYNEILQTLAKLRTDQGLSIDEANKLADSYLRFARVAKTDAPTAVKSFDDVLDAFNLKAEDGVRLMDLLVASNQKFGGSLTQRVADLATLAPALQGLNLTVDDGIALENLFAEAGINSSEAMLGLNRAIAGLKPGQTFDDLVLEVSSIEDPTLRAQRAIEIFGRGGTKFAQAFRPGITSLKDFGIAGREAAGSLKDAAASIDSSIPAQFQQAINSIKGTLQDLIGGGGPILLTIASLAQLGLAFDALKIKALESWAAVLGPAAVGVAVVAGGFVIFTNALADQGVVLADTSRATAEYTRQVAFLDMALKDGSITQAQYDAAVAKLTADYQETLAAAEAAAGGHEMVGTAAADSAFKVTTASDASAKLAHDLDLVLGGMGLVPTRFSDAGTGVDTFTGKLDKALPTMREFVKIMGEILESVPGVGLTLGESFLLDQQQDQRNIDDADRREKERIAELKRLRAAAAAEAKADAAAYARVVRGELTDAFRASKAAADAFFDALHKHNLVAIEDARTAANAILEEQKKALFMPVDAAQAALDAKRKADQRRGLESARTQAALGVGEAAKSGDPAALVAATARLREARSALADFDAQARIDAQRATAQAAVDALTAEQKANDDKAALAVADENKSAAARKKAFDDGLAKLEQKLLTEKGSHAKTLAAIAKLYVDAGIDSKSSGAQIALGLAAGLLSEITAVESAAKTLAAAVAKYIKTGSPAAAGPFHEMSPEAMGGKVADDWGKGFKDNLPDLGPAMRALVGELQMPAMSAAFAGGPIAPAAAAAIVPSIDGGGGIHVTVDLGTEFAKRFGGNRFIDGIARDMSYRRRGTGSTGG